jgi:mRNA interferase RelE/StbE
MDVFYAKKAVAQFEALPRQVQKRIATKMRFFASQSNPLQFAERLTKPAEGDYRFRIGEYRLIFDVVKGVIYILNIRLRDKAYNK